MNMTADFTLDSAMFASEFASFVNFLGAENLDNAISKVGQKLSQLPSSVRALYGERYFFHGQCLQIVHGPNPFQLDPTNFLANRAASLIAGINRARAFLSPSANARLRGMCLDNLKPDRDIRQLEHEIRCLIHFGQKGLEVSFADLEGEGRFDLVCKTQTKPPFEVESKTVTEDTGSQIKTEMTVGVAAQFHKAVHNFLKLKGSGLYILTLKRPGDRCKNLVAKFKSALPQCGAVEVTNDDFSLRFEDRPIWSEYVLKDDLACFQKSALSDSKINNRAHIVTRVADHVVGLVLIPHKDSTLAEKVVDVACTRFRRHQVRCFNGTGGASWSVGSLRASSSLRLCG